MTSAERTQVRLRAANRCEYCQIHQRETILPLEVDHIRAKKHRAGQLLQQLISALPPDRSFEITVFGSAPLQIMIDSRLNSADVDLFSSEKQLREFVDRAGLGQDTAAFYIQVSSELNFRTSPRWKDRLQTINVHNCTLRYPHPIDILIAKLNRLDE